MRTFLLTTTVALLALGCGGGDDRGSDAGPSGTDAGPTDTDGGMMVADPCAAPTPDEALTTLGCNGGFVSGEPVANGPLGECTPGGEDMPAGTCTTTNAVCAAEGEATEGTCTILCPRAESYVSTGGCPTGFRCFLVGSDEFGICFRDCDASNACPADYHCDEEGSCIFAPPEAED